MTDLGDELARYWVAKRACAQSLRTMSEHLQGGSPMKAVLGNLASAVADPLAVPAPFWDGPRQSPVPPSACYDVSFGRVHVQPGCRC